MTYLPSTSNKAITPVLTAALIVVLVPVVLHFLSFLVEGLSEETWSKNVAVTCGVFASILMGVIPGLAASNARKTYYKFLTVVLTLLMALLILPVTMQILSRYTGLIPRYIWTEEIARFCFIWIVMIGAIIAVEDDAHFDVDLLPPPHTLRGRGIAKIIVHGAVLLIAVNFIIFGYDFAMTAVYQLSEISELPMIVIYIAWPLAGVSWTIFLSTKIVEDIQRICDIVPYSDTQDTSASSDPQAQTEEVL
jgi:TRAP-type C4-dicarboxylate transport system permease small subunit